MKRHGAAHVSVVPDPGTEEQRQICASTSEHSDISTLPSSGGHAYPDGDSLRPVHIYGASRDHTAS